MCYQNLAHLPQAKLLHGKRLGSNSNFISKLRSETVLDRKQLKIRIKLKHSSHIIRVSYPH